MTTDDPMIERLTSLGASHESMRVMILTSSRCSLDARDADIFSDYDVEVFARAPHLFGRDDGWFEALGPVLVTYREEFTDGHPSYTRLVQYEDGGRIDFGIAGLDELAKRCEQFPDEYDAGYQIIFDKDGLTAGLRKPTYRAFIPTKPDEAEYLRIVREFWWDSTYVPKYLWRGDVAGAKGMLHWLAHEQLRRMLEWSIEIDRGWNWKPGHFGRGITNALDPETRAELVASYAGGEIDDLWESLFKTAALFRRVAGTVAERLGYAYPTDVDERVTTYNGTVRSLGADASKADLAGALKAAYQERVRP